MRRASCIPKRVSAQGRSDMHHAGFSLVELMITMVVFVFVIASVSQVFTGLLTQFKQQSKIAETNIEGAVGLDILRRDMGHAGYGLPWNPDPLPSYTEAGNSRTDVPKAFEMGTAGINGSDSLIIRATNISNSAVAQAWAPMYYTDTKTNVTTNANRLSGSNFTFADTNTVIVISPGIGSSSANQRILRSPIPRVYSGVISDRSSDATDTRVVYGIDDANMSMPFNRADYSISTSNRPSRCAQGTGVLEKAVVSQSGGTPTSYPLLDCVAGMRIIYASDANEDGSFTPTTDLNDTYTDNITGLTAANIRNRIKEIRVYILAHEGQIDRTFTYSSQTISLGSDVGLGRSFDLAAIAGADWQHYRWKVYTIIVKTNDLL